MPLGRKSMYRNNPGMQFFTALGSKLKLEKKAKVILFKFKYKVMGDKTTARMTWFAILKNE